METKTLNLNKDDYKILRKQRAREVTMITGASGAGKSLLMTDKIDNRLMAYHVINSLYADYIGSKFLPAPLQVWSNYLPEPFWYYPTDDGINLPPAILSAKLLDVERLYTFAPEMREGHVYIDELDLIADRQDWASGGQKLLMAILRQIRKRHMSMTASIQSISWLNPRFYFHLDTIISCKDASVTAWGLENGIEPGDMTFLYTKDRSGLNTGYSFEENGQIYDSFFRGKDAQRMYNTDQEFNPFEHMISYSVKRKHKEIDPFGGETEQQMEESQNQVNDVVARTLSETISQGLDKVSLAEFSKALKANGLDIKRAKLTEHLQEMHNVEVYQRGGYPWLRLNQVSNIPEASAK